MKRFCEIVFALIMIAACLGMIALIFAALMLPVVMSALFVASLILFAAQHGRAEYAIAMLAGMVSILFMVLELVEAREDRKKKP